MLSQCHAPDDRQTDMEQCWYYDKVTAPDKDLIWFENSAHGPMGEEPVLYKKLLREKFLQHVK